MKKQLPIDMSTFSRIIKEGYLYIDKTEQIARLFTTGKRYFFLSRPRRFGKSLLISTLKSLFRGEKELFDDLWIGKQKDFKWQDYPVIHIDFSLAQYRTPEELEQSLNWMLDRCAKEYDITLSNIHTPKAKLVTLVEALAKLNTVVILIDEYDKPILDHLHDPAKANAQREVLKSFYDVFKGLDEYLRCIFITGVSKFAKTSVFSGLNNLTELFYTPEGADLVGYTQNELETFFAQYIEDLASEQKESIDSIKEKIKHWYNGYQFSKKPIKIYNPYSIGYLFSNSRFENYWFESGTPTFLIEHLKRKPWTLRDVENKAFHIALLGTFQIDNIPLETLFFQSGYLTIKEYDEQYDVYRITYPNDEIRQSIGILELGVLTGTNASTMVNTLYQLRYALENKNLDVFAQTIRSLLANIPSYLHIEREAYYHSLIQLLCTTLGLATSCEVVTSKGRIDLVLFTEKYIYVIELKFNTSAQKALEQIHEKKYYEKYQLSGKEIILVGLALNYKEKELSVEWVEGSI
jgi:hypothetical protein